MQLLLKRGQEFGKSARKRIEDHFSIAKLRRDYDAFYGSVFQGAISKAILATKFDPTSKKLANILN